MTFSRQLNNSEIRMLLKIYLSNHDNSSAVFTMSALEKQMGFQPGFPTVRKLLHELYDIGVLVLDSKTLFGYKLFYFNRKELRKVIETQDLHNLFKSYFIYNLP
jgi:hypothetical protein